MPLFRAPSSLEHLQGWEVHNLSGQLVPVPHPISPHLTVRNVFLISNLNLASSCLRLLPLVISHVLVKSPFPPAFMQAPLGTGRLKFKTLMFFIIRTTTNSLNHRFFKYYNKIISLTSDYPLRRKFFKLNKHYFCNIFLSWSLVYKPLHCLFIAFVPLV